MARFNHPMPIGLTAPQKIAAQMSTYLTTHATQDDLPALVTILDATELFPSDILGDMIAPYLAGADSDCVWLTLRDGPQVTGFCYAVPEQMAEGVWNMLAIAVLPDCQGKGCGAALVSALEFHLSQEGARILIADTSGTDDFADTRAFYVARGYTAEARIRDFWAQGDDKVVFWKSLVSGD